MRAVPVDEPMLGEGPDYADAFEVRVDEPDGRTPEEWARAGLEEAPVALRRLILVVHRHILRLRLDRRSDAHHVLAWPVTLSTADVVRLQACGPLIRGEIVGRRDDPTSLVLTTAVHLQRPAARLVWRAVAPLHRRVTRYLLAYAAERATAPGPTGRCPTGR